MQRAKIRAAFFENTPHIQLTEVRKNRSIH